MFLCDRDEICANRDQVLAAQNQIRNTRKETFANQDQFLAGRDQLPPGREKREKGGKGWGEKINKKQKGKNPCYLVSCASGPAHDG